MSNYTDARENGEDDADIPSGHVVRALLIDVLKAARFTDNYIGQNGQLSKRIEAFLASPAQDAALEHIAIGRALQNLCYTYRQVASLLGERCKPYPQAWGALGRFESVIEEAEHILPIYPAYGKVAPTPADAPANNESPNRHLLNVMDEATRLRGLTNRQLVIEYLSNPVNGLAMEEMMTRLWPGWSLIPVTDADKCDYCGDWRYTPPKWNDGLK